MKKVLIGFGIFIAFIIAVLLLVPMFVSVDQFRPKIETAVNAKVRGKVELGQLSLRAFPSLKINIASVVAHAPAPYNKQPLANVGSVDLEMPLLSLLASPKVIVKLNKPQIVMVQNGEQSNLTAFLPAPEAVVQTPPPADQQQAVGESLKALPGWLENRVRAARIDFEINEGEVSLQDLKAPKASKTELHKLNLALQGIGIANPISTHVDTIIDYAGGGITAQGEVKSDGKITYTPDGKNNNIQMDIANDLSKLDIAMKPLMHKPNDMAFTVGMKGSVVQGPVTSADIQSLDLKFDDLVAKASLKANDVTNTDKATIDLNLNADDVNLAPFGTLVPMVKEYKLGGKVSLNVKAEGAMLAPKVAVLVKLADVSGSTPQLQRPIKNLNGQIKVEGTAKNPAVTIDPFSMKIGSSDLAMKVQTNGLDNIVAKVNLSSKRFNADELMGLQPLQVGDTPAGATPPPAANAEPAKPLDDSLDQMAPTVEEALKNPMLDKVKANIVLDFKSIKALGAEYQNATFNMSYAARQLKVSKTGIGGYGGKVTLDANLGLNPKAIAYDFSAALAGVKIQEMTKAHAPKWKDEMTGTLNGDFKLAGRGIRKAQLAETLTGGLKGDVKEGRTSLPIVKIVGGVVKSLPSVGGKKMELPQKDKTFKGEFKTCKIVSSIQGRMVNLQDLDINYDTIDLGIGELLFKANGTVSFDRQVDITGVAFLDPTKVQFDPLKGASGKIELPLKIKGDLSDPKPDYGYTTKIVGPKLAKGFIQSKAGQDVINKVQEKAPEPVKKGIDALKKKFHF